MSSEQGNIGTSVRKIAVEICGRVLWGKSWGKVSLGLGASQAKTFHGSST